MALIDPDRVEIIFSDCLFRDMEEYIKVSQGVICRVSGIHVDAVFHLGRLRSYKEEIFLMLSNLPDEFMLTGGGGWTFLNACDDRAGDQWTGLHQRMDQLFMLGFGLGLVTYCLPREMWGALPGGMPYLVINQ